MRINVILRVRHQSEHVALWIADASNVENGSVRVEGIISVGRSAVRVNVGEGDLVILYERRKMKEFGCLEVALTMRNWASDVIFQVFCPNAGL